MDEKPFFDQSLVSVVGLKAAKPLTSLGLETVGDLLYHFPRRYFTAEGGAVFSKPVLGEHVTVVARVKDSRYVMARTRKHHLLKLVIEDQAGHTMDLTLISRDRRAVMAWQNRLPVGHWAMFDGKIRKWNDKVELSNARFELIGGSEEQARAFHDFGLVVPVYPASAKVPSWLISRTIKVVLPLLETSEVPDPLPVEILAMNGWPSAREALRLKHDPRTLQDVRRADERLKFEEAFVLQAALARRRQQASALPATPRPATAGGLLAAFDASLPFELTAGQRAAVEQIARDLAAEHPMHRLLQGEVGSGKTIVALRAMLTVVDAGGQAALLAPTEVLAQQHHRSITAMMGNLASAGMLQLTGPVLDDVPGTQVTLLTGSLGARAKREALAKAASGEAGIVVGTHALLQESVEFADLGLVVVDEQHRFGVEQRDALRAKSLRTPHLLVMTATPIPRTVAMTVFGDLETSVMREVPAGRQPVASHVVPAAASAWVARMWEVVAEQVRQGRQAYVVCPAIDPAPAGKESAGKDSAGQDSEPEDDPAMSLLDLESPTGEPQQMVSVTQTIEELRENPALAGVRLGMLHGRMPAEEKDAAMSAFAAGEIDVLVSTTVIEVGVDVPNASVMVVMDASRFGISQLHQLRGRVGRGGHAGYCFFATSHQSGEGAVELLEKVAGTRDGFALAKLDLEHRREGDVLGAAQSGGMSSLRVLRVTRDEDVIVQARELANDFVSRDPDLVRYPELHRAIQILLAPEREVFLERG